MTINSLATLVSSVGSLRPSLSIASLCRYRFFDGDPLDLMVGLSGLLLGMALGIKQDRPWWSYAPLIAFAVSFWPYARPILALLEGRYVHLAAGEVIFSFLLFPAANLAFVVLFYVARQKKQKQRSSGCLSVQSRPQCGLHFS